MDPEETFESYVEKIKSIVMFSFSGSDNPIPDAAMVLRLVDILPSACSHLKEEILSKCPFPTFKEACYVLYMYEHGYKHGHNKDPVKPIKTDPVRPIRTGTPRAKSSSNSRTVVETFGTLGDAVDGVGKLGDAVDLVGKLGVPVAAGVSSVASVASAIGPLGIPIKIMGLLTLGGWKIWKDLSRK